MEKTILQLRSNSNLSIWIYTLGKITQSEIDLILYTIDRVFSWNKSSNSRPSLGIIQLALSEDNPALAEKLRGYGYVS